MMDTWRNFGIAISAFLFVSGFFTFIAGTQKTLSTSTRALDAIATATQTLLIGLAVGFVIWCGLRLIKGKAEAPDVRETMMVPATVFGVICIALVLYR